ncbi:MAG: hypothetical protein ABIP30_02245, partial [Ferruginibacter sp.]
KLEKNLISCYGELLKNNRTTLAVYQIAEYTAIQPDASGYDTEEVTYAILEVPANENQTIGGDCKLEKTFYIRIPADLIATAIPIEKPIPIQPYNPSPKNNSLPHSLAALGKITVEPLKSGIYNGEQTNGVPDGYGIYLLADGSFYCGSFVNGKINGNGVMYNSSLEKAFIGNWVNGKLNVDYYEVSLNKYGVDIYTARGNEQIKRAGMWVNEDGERIATANMTNVFTNDQRGIYNNLSAYGTMSVMYNAYTNDNDFSKGKTANFYSDRESEIFNMSTTIKYASGTDKSLFEKDLTYSVPSYLYPTATVSIDNAHYYFGKLAMNKGNGYGSIASKNRGGYLLTAMFTNGEPKGFKQEVFNGKNKFMYAGDFELNDSGHTGTFAKFNYSNPKDISIQIGGFSNDGQETLLNGIYIQLGPTKKAVTFKSSQQNNSKGYIMLPAANTLYRGGLSGVSAEGMGEVLKAGNVTLMILKKASHRIKLIVFRYGLHPYLLTSSIRLLILLTGLIDGQITCCQYFCNDHKRLIKTFLLTSIKE